MQWINDRGLVAQLPMRYRFYARYLRAVADPCSGCARGGSFLLRLIHRVGRLLRLRETVMIDGGARGRLLLDLSDTQMTQSLDELCPAIAPERIMQHCWRSAPGTFLDLGANAGTFSFMAATKAAKVIAVEPNPRLAALVRATFAVNGWQHCEIWEVAASDEPGSRELFIPIAAEAAGSLHAGYQASQVLKQIPVRAERIDDLLAGMSLPGKMLIKLDVEGSEQAVLRGAERLVREHRPVILFEVNPHSARAAGSSTLALAELLRSYGYTRFAEPERYPEGVGEAASFPWEQQGDLVALPPDWSA
jgi:FkbM family methyltransferase